jgi:hypothetical protein
MAKLENVEEQTVKISPFVSLTARDIMSTFVAGLIVGILYLGASYLLNTYVFGNVLCRAQASADCAQAPVYSMIVASVLSGLVGIGLLVRLRIYRPLLVVAASLISLWGIGALLFNLPLYAAFIISAILFGLCYAVFTWFIRIRSFILAMVAVVVLIVVLRLIVRA